MTAAATLIVTVLTALTLTLGLIGLTVRLVLLPWLRDHIALPVQQTNRQVSVNGHTSSTPTLLDRIDTLTREASAARSKANEARLAALAAGQMLEGHLERSADEWARLWRAIESLQEKDTPK